jgi:hypothetical protein
MRKTTQKGCISMTDMVVYKHTDIFDIHTHDKRACSGFRTDSIYKTLSALLFSYEYNNFTGFTRNIYHEYGEGYRPLMPVFLLRFTSDSE